MKEKFKVHVRNGDGTYVETIYRVLRSPSTGTICEPVYCTYRGKQRLVESSAPYLKFPIKRVMRQHIGKMYIRPMNEKGEVFDDWKMLDENERVTT